MTNFTEFFAQVAAKFTSRYQQRAQLLTPPTPNLPVPVDQLQPEQPAIPVEDKYVPETGETEKVDNPTYPKPEAIVSDDDDAKDLPEVDDDDSNEQPKIPAETAEPSFYRRSASLDYKMKLEFNLSAFSQSVEKIANGEMSVEEFAAAQFGLNAAFDIKGKEIIETNMMDDAQPGKLSGFSKQRSLALGKLSAQTRDFHLNSFYRESSRIASKMHIETADGYRRAVNKFALRYRLDNKFSFDFMNRFNVQTEKMVNSGDKATSAYVDSAGNVAAKATPEMMATFFNAVDEYLNAAESDLIAKAGDFFDAAVEQLGLSSEVAGYARDQIIGSVSSFFERVDNALAQVSSAFVPTELLDISTPSIPSEFADKTELALA